MSVAQVTMASNINRPDGGHPRRTWAAAGPPIAGLPCQWRQVLPRALAEGSMPPLFASDHGVPLDLDLCVGICQSRDRDHCAAREIVAEDLPADLPKVLAIADIGHKNGHL